MARNALVESDIRFGERFMQELDRQEFPIDAALWQWSPEVERWRLVIASPTIDAWGPIRVYTLLQSVLASFPPAELATPWPLSLEDILVVSPTQDVVQRYRHQYRVGRQFPGSAERKNLVQGLFTGQEYFYRL